MSWPQEPWVINVSPSEPVGYLGLLSDEDDQGTPPRTRELSCALTFATFEAASAECTEAVARWPTHAFKVEWCGTSGE